MIICGKLNHCIKNIIVPHKTEWRGAKSFKNTGSRLGGSHLLKSRTKHPLTRRAFFGNRRIR